MKTVELRRGRVRRAKRPCGVDPGAEHNKQIGALTARIIIQFSAQRSPKSLPIRSLQVNVRALDFVAAGHSVTTEKGWKSKPLLLSGKTMVNRDAGGDITAEIFTVPLVVLDTHTESIKHPFYSLLCV